MTYQSLCEVCNTYPATWLASDDETEICDTCPDPIQISKDLDLEFQKLNLQIWGLLSQMESAPSADLREKLSEALIDRDFVVHEANIDSSSDPLSQLIGTMEVF